MTSRTHLVHDDGAVNSELEVNQGVSDHADDALHAVKLLPQEDVERLQRSHLPKPVVHLDTQQR